MTHTTPLPPPPPIEDPFLTAIGRLLAEEATPAMLRDLTDAFILIKSMDSAAPYLPAKPTEMEHYNEDPV